MKRNLSIHISEHFVQIHVIENQEIIDTCSHVFRDKQDYRYKEQLEQIFTEKGYKSMEIDEVTIFWFTPNSTLVPANIFGESSAEALFKICFQEDIPSQFIDYNRIPELGIVNVFEIPLWVKSFFIIKYPRAIIQHEGTAALRLLSKEGKNYHCLLFLRGNLCWQIVVKDKEPIHYTGFEFLNTDDILYHTIHSFDLLGIKNQATQIEFITELDSQLEIIENYQESIQKITDLGQFTIEKNEKFSLKIHQLCV